MLKFIQMEFFKLKNSKMFLLTLLGSLAPTLLVYLGFVGRLDFGESINYALLSGQTHLYMLGVFGVFLTTVIVSYMFSREYSEHTLKSIFTAPVSRSKYLVGKSVSFLIWILILCSVCFITSTILCIVTGVDGLILNLFSKHFSEMLIGGCLLFLVMTPLMFIAMLMRSMVPAMIVAAILSFGNIIAYGHEEAIVYPWILPTMLSSGEITSLTSNLTIPYVVVLITFVVGLVLSYVYLTQKDVRL